MIDFKDFVDSQQTLVEVMDTPVKINWTQRYPTNWDGMFKINDADYHVEFMKQTSGTWVVLFAKRVMDGNRAYPEYDIRGGDGGEFQVFSTIISGIIEHNKEYPDSGYTFSSDKKEPSRVKLYNRLAKVYAKRYGMKLTLSSTSSEQYYKLTK